MQVTIKTEVTKALLCMACGADRIEPFRTGVRNRPDQKVVECKACGLQFLHPFPSYDLKEYYDSKYRGTHNCEMDTKRTSEDRFNDRHYELQDNLETVLGYVCPESRVLEIGCAAGAMLSMLQPHVKEVVGLDYNSEDAHYAADKLDIATYTTDLWETGIGHNSFDVICAFHVIEHVEDPVRWLYKIRPYLKNDGVIILATPNLDHPYMTLWDIPEFADFWYREPHLYYFNMDTLEKITNAAGYSGEVTTAQIYNIKNLFHWMYAREPQKDAVAAQSRAPVLINRPTSGGIDVLMNHSLLNMDSDYRNLLMKHSRGDILYYVGGRYVRGADFKKQKR